MILGYPPIKRKKNHSRGILILSSPFLPSFSFTSNISLRIFVSLPFRGRGALPKFNQGTRDLFIETSPYLLKSTSLFDIKRVYLRSFIYGEADGRETGEIWGMSHLGGWQIVASFNYERIPTLSLLSHEKEKKPILNRDWKKRLASISAMIPPFENRNPPERRKKPNHK